MFGLTYSRYSLRKYISMFGTLFSNVVIPYDDGTTRRVPCTHANKEFFWKALNDYPNKKQVPPDSGQLPQVAAYLPRMSFEISGPPSYDSTRKKNLLNELQRTDSNGDRVSMLEPVPFIIPFDLSIWTRTYRDMLVIAEQIMPFFQPHYNVTVREYPDFGVEEFDVPVVFNGVADESTIEGGPGEKRMIRWTMSFDVYGHLAPPVGDPQGLVKTVIVDFTGEESDITDPNFEAMDSIEVTEST